VRPNFFISRRNSTEGHLNIFLIYFRNGDSYLTSYCLMVSDKSYFGVDCNGNFGDLVSSGRALMEQENIRMVYTAGRNVKTD
jgi:hypothetical protein